MGGYIIDSQIAIYEKWHLLMALIRLDIIFNLNLVHTLMLDKTFIQCIRLSYSMKMIEYTELRELYSA